MPNLRTPCQAGGPFLLPMASEASTVDSSMADGSADSQAHPLYATDRDLVDRLLATEVPENDHLVELARLLIRYQGFPGAQDLQDDLAKTLRLWGLDLQELHRRTRQIWTSGYRPGVQGQEQAVGSGFDTADAD